MEGLTLDALCTLYACALYVLASRCKDLKYKCLHIILSISLNLKRCKWIMGRRGRKSRGLEHVREELQRLIEWWASSPDGRWPTESEDPQLYKLNVEFRYRLRRVEEEGGITEDYVQVFRSSLIGILMRLAYNMTIPK